MRRATLLLALFAFWGNLLQLSAQNDYIYLGNTDINSGNGSGTEEVGGALLINASELTLLVGSQIESLCIYQNGYNPEYINAFVSEDLSGQIIGSKMITDVKKGWNTIVFDSPITIPNGDLYIGYKIKSENANIGTLTNKGSDFESFYYHTGEWHPYDLNMSVYALVGGENIPTRNVRITYCDFPNEIKNGESYPAEFSFKNLASKNVNSLQVDFSINEQVMKSWHFDNLDIAQLEEHKLAIADLQLSENGDHQAKLSITQFNGDAYQNPSDNSYHSEVYVRAQFVPRKILIEIFST